MTVADVVPVALRLPTGVWFTLWRPGWADADDEQALPFPGEPGRVVAVTRAEQLGTLAASGPAWRTVAALPAADLRRPVLHDLTDPAGLAERALAGGDVAALRETALLLDDLATQADVDSPLDQDEIYLALLDDPEEFAGVLGRRRRALLRDLIAAHWPPLLARVTSCVGAAGDQAPSDGASVSAADRPGGPVPLEDVVDAEVLWLRLAGQAGYTLRRRPDPAAEPVFLGAPGELRLAGDLDTLAAHLRSGAAGGFPGEPAWADVVARGVDLEPYEDAVIDLDELGDAIDAQLGRDTALALLDAQLLVLDLAEWCGLDEVRAAFEQDRALGRLLVAVAPEVAQRAPRAAARLAGTDLDAVREEWHDCLAALGECIRKVGA